MPPQNRRTTPEPMPDREILNIDGAAALLGVSIKTFSKVLREGEVPGRKVGREWKFSRTALIEWVGSSRSRAFLDGAEEPPVRRAAPRVAPRARRPAAAEAGAGAGAGEAQAARGEATDAAGRRRRPLDEFSVDEL
jgi:excisionase family DNA binding protein